MSKIISISRRTDIPAFYGNWFMNRIKEGYAGHINPFGGQKYTVSLKPEDVICFVFWSKNFEPFMNSLKLLNDMDYKFYFNYTITGLPEIFECNLIPTQKAMDNLKKLSELFSPKHINWRYDPIVISDITDYNFHLENFENMAANLKNYTERCYFSYAIQYGKVQRNFEKFRNNHKINVIEPDLVTKINLANKLAEIAEKYNITMYSCCGDVLINEKIKKAHCIDGDIIKELFYKDNNIKSKILPTRKECGCTASIDIGAYDTCPHGCIYCYANINKEKAYSSYNSHEPESVFLGYSVEESKRFEVSSVSPKSQKQNGNTEQLSFFENVI